MVLPLLAWVVLPKNINFTLFGHFDVHAWNVFLFIGAWSPITSSVVFFFMPESPKFLMTDGRNEEAIKVFRKIYTVNTGKTADSYPIKALIDEHVQNGTNAKENVLKRTVSKAIVQRLYQMKPLFCPPHILKLLHVSLNACVLLMSYFTLLLWLPQLFQSINDYKFTHNGSSSSICEMISDLTQENTSTASSCVVNLENSEVYINSTIVTVSTVVSYVFAALFVNLLGKKRLTIVMTFISGCCAMSIYFAQNSEALLVLSAIFLSFTVVCTTIIIAITLELFPTNLRSMALSIHLMNARLGSILGNILFPILLRTGCAPPFLFTGSAAIGMK
ncbi:hypothetical protein NQ314_019132 [Rhamnusium bicolor]|uniref:Major facilitator superfamily (MFS) profile domain-containing protein n=1 Tax=Rhamnusium bicolor TaxID=1586634 RepID=A0AAV8WPU8_9CUCU|nr:hypothetical protein NQ314_019132 [Rhamnusium bicolor]